MTTAAVSWIRGGRAGAVCAGMVAGLAGGVVLGAAEARLGEVGSPIMQAGPPVMQVAFAGAIGALFGLLAAEGPSTVAESMLWGLLYGAFWWFAGPLTLLPLSLGRPVTWDLVSAQSQISSLIGLLCYGAIMSTVFSIARYHHLVTWKSRLVFALRGVIAGLLVVAFLAHFVLGVDISSSPIQVVAVGAIIGLLYSFLFGSYSEGAGPALIRGVTYGFLCWIVGALTIPGLLHHPVGGWSRNAALASIGELPIYILLGAGVGLVFTVLGSFSRWLFVDDVTKLRVPSPGPWGLRATGYGALAGLAGGAVYTVVMVVINGLPRVARIVGGHDAMVGLIVHLVIAQLIGISYAVLFRGRSYDLGSGIGWGASYGFFWWTLGSITLFPILTDTPVRFNSAAIAAGFPSLVGHLAYGAALGVCYYRLEERINPWWFTRSDVEARRITARQDQMFRSAPALWGLTTLIVLTILVIVS